MTPDDLLTASALERVMACPPSAVLPRVDEPQGPAAGRGIVMHGFLAEVPELGRDEALARIPDDEHRAACEAIDLDALPLDGAAYAAEVSYAWDVETRTARQLGHGRAYETVDPEREIAGCADVVGLRMSSASSGLPDAGVLLDWKTGARSVPAARDNWQLRFLAVAVARAHGLDSMDVAIVYLHRDGSPWFDHATFDAFDLLAIEQELTRLHGRVAEARAALALGAVPRGYRTGEHCLHCPAIRSCHAQTALIREVTSNPRGFADDALLSPEHIADAYRKLKLAKGILDRLDQAIHAHAAVTPIDLGDGVMLGAKVSERESVDGVVARRVLAELHGQDIADRACTWDASKASVLEALRKVAQDSGQKITPLNRAALEAIAAAGGIATKVSHKIAEFRPKKELQP